MRRLGKPEDISALTLFLCSEKARHIQGTAIAVDGGATARLLLIVSARPDHEQRTSRAPASIGWPVKHSRSPLIHGHWIEQHQLDGCLPARGDRAGGFRDFITHLAERGYVGANITIPHKEAALAMSEPDDRARAVGAANTLWYDGGRLRSTNTDVEGFTANLDQLAPGWEQRPGDAVVLGAGGSARAIIYGLIERGMKRSIVVNRTLGRARRRCRRASATRSAGHRDRAAASARRRGLLVNTTSLGMTGQPPLDLISMICPRTPWSPTWSMRRWKRRCWRRPGSRGLRHRRRARDAAASGGAGLPALVRGAPEVTPELRALVEKT